MFQFTPADMQYMAIQLFSAYASFSTCMMMFRTILRDLAPEPLRSQLQSLFMSLLNDYAPESIRSHLQSMLNNDQLIPSSSSTTIIVEEQYGDSRNEVFDAAQVYLRTKVSPNTWRFKVGKTATEKKLHINIDKNQDIMDTFNNTQVTWKFGSGQPKDDYHTLSFNLGHNHLGSSSFPSNFLGSASLPSSNMVSAKDDDSIEKHYFELSFDNNIKEKVLEDYLPYVIATAKKIKDAEKVVKLYTTDRAPYNDEIGGRVWGSANLVHPASFETLVMDIKTKSAIIEDLERFVKRRDYYKKVGKAWKRGYLLYGPSGTDKSSLVAAMANYLKFDVYDLHLSSVQSSSDLRRLLVSTTNCSIIVIEDVDRNSKIQNQSGSAQDSDTQLMLSSILNFLDGLWSDERIVIFTTSSKDKLDPTFLSPGRMDMHIQMSYCTYHGFRLMVSNYFGIHNHHRLFDEIQILLSDLQITHAEISEELIKTDTIDAALAGFVNYLKRKKSDGLPEEEEEEELPEEEEEEDPLSDIQNSLAWSLRTH